MRGLTLITVTLLTIGCSGDPADGPGADAAPDTTTELTLPPTPLPTEIDLTRWDPQWYRLQEISLSGAWDFAFDPEGDGVEDYDQVITVPFPWQSELSGVGASAPDRYPPMETEATLQTYRGDAWYRRTVTVPSDWPAGDVATLRFGAVDWEARIFLDRVEAAHHVGGYTPFEVALDAGPGEDVLVEVQVTDPCDDDDGVLVGKQGGIWYTCSAGIWQDVTLSHRPPVHLAGITDLPTAEGLEMQVRVRGGGAGERIFVHLGGSPDPILLEGLLEETPEGSVAVLTTSLDHLPAWSPDQPTLLPRAIGLGAPPDQRPWDLVLGYTARRTTSMDWVPGHGPDDPVAVEDQYKDLLNDGRAVHLRAVLDQGYHPLGIWQAPTRADRIADLEAMKALGMNGVRMHIKPEPPWYYAAADALGLWVVYDMPCPWDQAPSGADAAWRPHWEAAARGLVERDRNHPAILWWVNFNEAWGLLNPPFWGNDEGTALVEEMYHLVQDLDPTRPVEDHSPGGFSEILGVLPHVDTDVNSFHSYVADPQGIAARLAAYADGVYPGSTDNVFGGPPQDGAPLIVSEMGGQWAGATWGDGAYPLHAWLNALRAEPKVRGWVFTQLSDVEWETNGLLTYDRLPKDLGLDELGLDLRDLLGDLYLHLNPDPVLYRFPDACLPMEAAASSFGTTTVARFVFSLQTREGEVVQEEELAGVVLADGLTELGPLSFDCPAEQGIYVLKGTAEDGNGAVIARQALYLISDCCPPGGPGLLDPATALVDGEGGCPEGRACRCAGTCGLSFFVEPPAPGTWRLKLLLEASTWDGPPQQTDPILAPGDVEVFLDDHGLPAGSFHVLDAPADHRGVLSLGAAWPALRGAYGELVEVDLGIHEVGESMTLTLAAEDTGVQIFFRDGGRYLEAPRVIFEAAD